MIYFLIPIFNEELNIPALFNELNGLHLDSPRFYVFSDDGSKDQSAALIHSYFKATDYILLGDGQNHGPGHAFNTGFEWILQHSQSDNDKILTLEADTTSDVTLIPAMLGISDYGFSLVLASVYAQNGGFDSTSFFRQAISSIANLMFRFLFNIKVLTLSSFFRVYDIKLIKKIKEQHSIIIQERGFICMLDILIKAIECNARIIEVPMTLHSSKRKGASKMKVVKTTMQYLRFFASRKMQKKKFVSIP